MFGIGKQKPHHYLEMARAAWENRDELPFAWRILNDGVCDGCALGTSGLSDWTIEGVHLCMVRLELMRLNTAPPLDPGRLANVDALGSQSSAALRALGRLPEPMLRRTGDRGFRAVSWDEALDRIAAELRTADPSRVAFYLTSRGLTNEAYYAAQKAARFLGSSHVDNSARLCHAASTSAMKATLGHGASTCSYTDWLHADLIVLFGSNVANNQPVTMKYLHHAKKNGAEIAVVNPYREPGLARYWIPSIPSSALFGTALAGHWFDVHTGGDRAFLTGVFRALVEQGDGPRGGIDAEYVRERTVGFDQARAMALASDWDAIERESGATRDRMEAFARLLIDRPNAVFVWSMGLTQHAHGVETIKALVNVGLARGLPGRANRGLVPIRGHSGVQGGAEVGCAPKIDQADAARWAHLWGFPVSPAPGWTASEMVDHSADGQVDVFWIVGGNFLETLPDAGRSRRALLRPRLRIHHDIVLSSSMLTESEGDVLLLPATTRYESPDGGTETSTERRIIFSPEIPGRRIGSARPEWQVFGDVMARVRPAQADRIRFDSAAAIRREIARAVPLYAGIETLGKKGDEVQWGGPLLYADGRFATPDGKAHFATGPAVRLKPDPTTVGGNGVASDNARDNDPRDNDVRGVRLQPDLFTVSTRRGKQFNSMVHRDVDPLTGAGRDAVFISRQDAGRLGLAEGARVRLRSSAGTFDGRVKLAPMRPGNLEIHWPEGNVLLSASAIDPESMEPDYNALVSIESV
ncbi:MAG: FdhF/YdeP family oxidoreductase [Vicinamibacterales bacterium]